MEQTTICFTGVWITLLLLPITVGSWELCEYYFTFLSFSVLRANKINPSWVALHTSRGIETPSSKLFMRLTAILPFYLIYLPVIYLLCRTTKNVKFSQVKRFLLILVEIIPEFIVWSHFCIYWINRH